MNEGGRRIPRIIDDDKSYMTMNCLPLSNMWLVATQYT